MKSYRPCNGSEGDWFHGKYCDRCANENQSKEKPYCDILSSILATNIGDVGYPKEVVCDDDGRNARCTSFKDKREVLRGWVDEKSG